MFGYERNFQKYKIKNLYDNRLEEPLPAGGSCLLGSLNLSEFVTNGAFDKNEFIKCIAMGVRALNDVLDEGLELHPLEEQRGSVRSWRQIGLGIFGLADLFIKLGIKYGSEESIELCRKIGKMLSDEALKESAKLAAKYGSYPKYDNDKVKISPYFIKNASAGTKQLVEEYGLRNSQLLTIPPTGTLAAMLGVSSACEPIFANYYTRKTESLHGEDKYYKVYTPIVEEYMKTHNLTDDSKLPDYFITAQDLDFKNRIDVQAALQSYIDASISSTVNLPNETTLEEIEQLYLYAWEQGLKGVTIYRDGCKRSGILISEETAKNDNGEEDIAENRINSFPRGYIADVSDDLIGYKRKLVSGCGSLHFEVYSDEVTGEPQETFINIGSGGSCERNLQFISRLISTALRGGIPIEAIIDQAMSIKPCNAYVNRTKTNGDTSRGTSCPSAIGYALKDLNEKMKDRCFTDIDLAETQTSDEQNCSKCTSCSRSDKQVDSTSPSCPECGEAIIFEGGCNICKNCGWSKCD